MTETLTNFDSSATYTSDLEDPNFTESFPITMRFKIQNPGQQNVFAARFN